MLVFSAEIKVQSQASLCGFSGQESGTGIGFSLSTLVLPCWYYIINTVYLFGQMSPVVLNLKNGQDF
jgi:hypothetical protein